MESFFKAIVENGDKISSTVLLLLAIVGIIYGLVTENLEIGPSVKRKNSALKEANDALTKTKDELNTVEHEYDRLEWEVEHGWHEKPTTTTRRRVPKRTRQ